MLAGDLWFRDKDRFAPLKDGGRKILKSGSALVVVNKDKISVYDRLILTHSFPDTNMDYYCYFDYSDQVINWVCNVNSNPNKKMKWVLSTVDGFSSGPQRIEIPQAETPATSSES